jgi:putative DNA primase/helicase
MSEAKHTARFIRAEEIHNVVGDRWPIVLRASGIGEDVLCNKHQSCPHCGGKDRFRFDNKKGRGDYFCSGCGPGDGFSLQMKVHGWDFSTARQFVMEWAGLSDDDEKEIEAPPIASAVPPSIAMPTPRVIRLLEESCAPADVPDAIEYLSSRGLWPLPNGCKLRAHRDIQYYTDGILIGRHPGLIAAVRDKNGELTTAHVTYLEGGRKLERYAPRKILSRMTGREGCSARLMPITGDSLGIAEGIETALAAARIHSVPTWAALNTSLLQKFQPPIGVKRLIIFADNDAPGLLAAATLRQRLQDHIKVEVCSPAAPYKDWNDCLQANRSHVST